jgi:TPR repeat protein
MSTRRHCTGRRLSFHSGPRNVDFAAGARIRNVSAAAGGKSRNVWPIAAARELLLCLAMTRRAVIVRTCVAALLLPVSAAAQDARDEGIRALLRGDYVEAARMLRPLAEEAQPGDQTALLLIGMLNDSGYAGQGGTLRACASYLAAAAAPGPFTEPATVLARMIREELGNGARFCADKRFVTGPVSFRNGVAAISPAQDGFSALARGEYDAAAAMLKPLGESDSSRDHVAQFLMGTLYHGGRGAPLDPLRACALYHRAANVDQSPFGAAAGRLMRGLWRAHDNEWFAACQALGNLGFDHRFEPVTFDLAPDHSVAWDFTGARVTYRGETTTFPFRPGGRGAAYLPLRLTTLRTSPSLDPRHFVEMLLWQSIGSTWQLEWHLFEIFESQVRPVAYRDGLASRPTRPPPADPSDVRTLVNLRINDAGLVEWSVIGTPGAGGTIESEGERRHLRAEEAARSAALAKVDWSATFDAARDPVLRYESNEGCGHVSLSALTGDRAEIILLRIDKRGLGLEPGVHTIDLAREPRVAVTVHVYDRPLRESPFCTDVGHGSIGEGIWRAVSGRITIELSERGVSARNPAFYRARVRIDGAEFVSAGGRRVRQTQSIQIAAVVGMMSGG